MKETAEPPIKLITCSDQSLQSENRLVAKSISGNPTIKNVKDKVAIIPGQYFFTQKMATMVTTTDDVIKLIRSGRLVIVCDADENDHLIPMIGQRIPTKDRMDKIRDGWNNKEQTPDSKVETIDLAVFGAEVTDNGLMLDMDSIVVVNDGAGRLTTLARQVNRVEEGFENSIAPKDRGFLWQLNFDLNADHQRSLQNFLLHNRDAKRCNSGTTFGVENALLEHHLANNGKLADASDCRERMTRAYIIRCLYRDFPIEDSVTELLPWSYEGKKSTSAKFVGRGKNTSLSTALKDLAPDLNKMGLKNKIPEFLDFAFRAWYAECPEAVKDARRDSEGKSEYHFHSTLALKVMIYISIHAYKKCKTITHESFVLNCEKILAEHFSYYKKSDYIPSYTKTKKMTMEKFWQGCVWFCTEQFNSGAVNSIKIMQQFKTICDKMN